MLQLMYNIDLPEAACYRDDSNDLQFYVLPKVPILRRDEQKKAVFKFVKYRTMKPMANGDVGAALVFMDVELALTPQQEQAVRQKLADIVKQGRGSNAEPVNANAIILSKPQISKANVKVEVLADSGNLVQKINHAGSPSMYGNNVVAMSAELNQLGAPIFEAVMKSEGAGGIKVTYDLEFSARLPPVRADGHWDALKFYSFSQTVDYDENFWSEDSYEENISELFVNSESMIVTVDPGALVNTDPEVAKVLDVVRSTVQKQLDEAVKRNLLEAIPPENRDVSKIRDEDIENIKRTVAVTKISNVNIHFRERQITRVDVHPQANMPSIVSQGFKWGDYAIEADTDDPFFRQLLVTIQVNADFENLPIFSVDVLMDYPPFTAKHGVQTFTFRKSDDIGKFAAFIEGGSADYKYKYVVNYKGESRTYESEWKPHQGNDLKINVDELGLWLVDVEVGDMNFDQVGRALLTLEHPEVAPGVPPVAQFSIDSETKKLQVKELLLEPVKPFKATLKYFMKDGREYIRELLDQKGQRFYADDPFSATKTVQIRTRGDFERRIDTIFVDLTYDDETNKYRQTNSIALGKDKRFLDWSFPVIDERAGKITYRAMTTFMDGTSSDSGDKSLEGTTLLLGEDVATLSVKLIPDLIDWERVKLLSMEIYYADPANNIDERESFTFRVGSPEAKYELAIRDRNRKTYEWTLKVFMVDGSKKELKSPGSVADEDLIIEIPA
jgi:hypothetical protein